MGLQASDWETLREMIQNFLYQIPEEVSSKDSAFVRWTGLTQKALEANWDAGGMLTSCNAFAGKIAQEIGVPRKSVLAKGVLDISQADKEVPGCWQDATSSEACLNNITPQAGDIYSSWAKVKYKGKEFIQKWGHVGIVYSFEDDGTWWLIQGGQGGPGGRVDYIRWKNAKFDRTKINGWIDIAKYLMPDGPARSATTHEYQSAR